MTTIDLFAGSGGLSLGLSRAGFDIVAAVDNWAPAVQTHRANLPHEVHQLDVSSHAVGDLLRDLKPQCIVGGPPCQDFSSAGKRNENGEKADMTRVFGDWVCIAQPDLVIMENVAAIVETRRFKLLCTLLQIERYDPYMKVVNAANYGVPQNRKRLILIGVRRRGLALRAFESLAAAAASPLTVRQYMGAELDVEHYYRHPRSYARRGVFSVDEPSPTIRGVNRPIPPGYKPHPGDATQDLTTVRPLTAAERARIQTFPPEWVWHGTRAEQEQQIGNAVPPNLAEHIGRAVMAAFE